VRRVHTATQCDTLCDTLQHTAIHCNARCRASHGAGQRLSSHCRTLQHAATRCNTLQHTATHCNTRGKDFGITDSTVNTTPPKSTKSRNSNSLVQIQIKPKSQCEFVPRDTEKLDFLDLMDFGNEALSVETVIGASNGDSTCCTVLSLLYSTADCRQDGTES